MSRYRPQSRDTSVDADRLLMARYRTMTAAAKIRVVRELAQASERLALAGARRRDPHASRDELRMRTAATRLSAQIMRDVFGWDPASRGRR